MKREFPYITFLTAALIIAGRVVGQVNPDLPKIPETWGELKSSVQLSGTISAATSVYAVSKIQNRRPPFKFNLYGTPTLKINDLVIPIRFTFGTYQNKYSQEFNRLGISPTYKNLTLHLGHCTMSFSPLALQGHNFLGAGVEWNPSNFRLGYVYGRFQRKIEPDSIAFFQENVIPVYNRTGMGLKAGYGKNDNYYDLVVFKGRDLGKSLDDISSWDLPSPAENAVIALSLRQQFLTHFQFTGDVAFSAYTVNVHDSLMIPGRFDLAQLPSLFLKDRTSTQYLKAIQTSLKYKLKNFSLSVKEKEYLVENLVLDLKYDRIDPEYRSMGTYFFRNDIERFSLSASFQAMDKRLTVSMPLGYEHNNLFGNKQTTNRRIIGGINARYQHSEILNFTLTASNFRSKLYQEYIPDYDTLVVNQVDRNFNLTGNYLLDRDGKKSKITARMGFQSGQNITLDKPVQKLSKMYLSGSYTFDYDRLDLVLTPNLGLYYYRFTGFGNFRMIPSLTAQKSFLQKKLSASYDLGLVLTKGLFGIRNQARANYKINDHQGVSLQLFLVQNLSPMNSFTEFQMELRWYYTF